MNSIFKNVLIVVFLITGCFSLKAQNCTPTISATSTMVCSGFTATLTAFGASSYTWLSSNNPSVVSQSLSAGPGVYTVTASSGTCTSSAHITIYIAPSLVIQVTTTTYTTCAGGLVTFSATGASVYHWVGGSTSYTGNPLNVTPTVSTTYSVTGYTSVCQGSAAAGVTVLNSSPLLIQASASSNTICSGTSVTFTASGANTYYWTDGNIGYTVNPLVVSPNVSSTYTVTGTSSGCQSSAAITVTVINCGTGVRQIDAINDLVSISPNPGNGLFLVSAEKLSGILSLEVYDIAGKLIQKMDVEKQSSFFHLEDAPKGVYTIRLISNGSPAGYKRIIKN